MMRVVGLGAAALAVAMVGCEGGDGLPRQPVSGTVTLDGQPLDYGSIQFVNAGAELTMSCGGLITDGRFAIPRDQGPIPGPYRVAIYAPDRGQQVPGSGSDQPTAPGSIPKDRVPPRYNQSTTLTAQVEKGDRNVFAFDLKSE